MNEMMYKPMYSITFDSFNWSLNFLDFLDLISFQLNFQSKENILQFFQMIKHQIQFL